MKGLQGMADQAKAANIRVAWCTPSPVEKAEEGAAIQGYNETLEKYSEGVKGTAEKIRGCSSINSILSVVAAQGQGSQREYEK